MGKTITVFLVILIVLVGGYFVFTGDKEEQAPVESLGQVTEEGEASGATDMVAEDSVKTFEVAGTNFKYSVEEIRVKKGDTVRIVFTSESGFHDWVVDEFDARTKQLQAPGSETIEFVADEVGEFEYYCSVGQHRANGMVGTLIVEE